MSLNLEPFGFVGFQYTSTGKRILSQAVRLNCERYDQRGTGQFPEGLLAPGLIVWGLRPSENKKALDLSS
jgi:hypothetical protein